MTGNEAKKIRESAGLTRQQFAEQLGCSIGCIQRNEQTCKDPVSTLYAATMRMWQGVPLNKENEQ